MWLRSHFSYYLCDWPPCLCGTEIAICHVRRNNVNPFRDSLLMRFALTITQLRYVVIRLTSSRGRPTEFASWWNVFASRSKYLSLNNPCHLKYPKDWPLSSTWKPSLWLYLSYTLSNQIWSVARCSGVSQRCLIPVGIIILSLLFQWAEHVGTRHWQICHRLSLLPTRKRHSRNLNINMLELTWSQLVYIWLIRMPISQRSWTCIAS